MLASAITNYRVKQAKEFITKAIKSKSIVKKKMKKIMSSSFKSASTIDTVTSK